MAEVIKMPKMSDTMTEGVIVEWHKKVGDVVKPGDILAEVETDKATMELENFVKGTLLHIGIEKGQAVPVDAVIAIVGKEGEDIQALLKGDSSSKPATEKTTEENPDSTRDEKEKGEEKAEPETKKEEKEAPAAEPAKDTETKSSSDSRLKVSPLARKIAEEKGIALNAIHGSGEYGRIVKRDLENVPVAGAAFVPVTAESYEDIPLSQMRKTIARRLGESMFTAPHFYLTMEIDMDAAVDSRKRLNEMGGPKISINDMIVKAAAVALRTNPKVNSSWLGDKIRINHHIHIGVAMAVDEGLVVPVVKFADQKSFAQINSEVKIFSAKAKSKKLQPEEFSSNTFTISNLGMYGIEEFTAIINPPDSCILAVGGVKEQPVVKGGQIRIGNVMKVTLSCDHRSVDGATGSAFLQTLKNYLEAPMLMLV
ncbi:MAG: pyruvate dehydrogenase complex dihydrolipoamide acetyltransferase [Bacteroidota bacterium]|nr:pyruvate dehydrogenase complex dihydrolipoamide acetyltransferase [Bacteroidota bacterium]